MNAVLRITHIDVRPSRHDNSTLEIVLENIGKEPVNTGSLLVHELLTDGSLRLSELHITNLSIGESARLSQPLRGSIKQVDFKGYRSPDGTVDETSLTGLLSWWQSPWSLKAA